MWLITISSRSSRWSATKMFHSDFLNINGDLTVPVFISSNMEDKVIIEIDDDMFYLDYEEYLAWKEFITKKEEEFKDFIYGKLQ